MSEARLRTPGRLADELGVPLHRVLHMLRTQPHVLHAEMAGILRLYDSAAIAQARHESNDQDARRGMSAAGNCD